MPPRLLLLPTALLALGCGAAVSAGEDSAPGAPGPAPGVASADGAAEGPPEWGTDLDGAFRRARRDLRPVAVVFR